MSDTLEYIDNYFTGRLSPTEKSAFEERCESDTLFAEDVAFYIAARASVKNELHAQKKKEFHDLYTHLSASSPPSKSIVRKIVPYLTAAAACILLFIAGQLFFNGYLSNDQQPHQLANQYIEKNIQQLGVTMGGKDQDSLDLGIAEFNKKNYAAAENIFLALSARKNENAELQKYLGFLYLVNGDYDNAIAMFDKLAQQTGLYANPGLFYKAVALMKRSSNSDVEEAKRILKEVIEKNLPGKKEATAWLSKM